MAHIIMLAVSTSPLYLAELDYKYNTRKVTDGARTIGGIQRITGKRLTYRCPSSNGTH